MSPREIHLGDWSHLKAPRDRHALWCVGYRLLTNPRERLRTTIWRVSNNLRFPSSHLTKLVNKFITITNLPIKRTVFVRDWGGIPWPPLRDALDIVASGLKRGDEFATACYRASNKTGLPCATVRREARMYFTIKDEPLLLTTEEGETECTPT